MLLTDLIEPQFIHLRSEMCSKSDITRHQLEHFRKNTPGILDLDSVTRAVEQRSALGGIVFPTGIAVPHARLDDFEDLLIGICVPAEAIPMEGVPVRMIVLMLTSRTPSSVYLNALAAFIKISQNAALFNSLLQAKNAHEFLHLLEEAAIAVKERVTAGDVMVTQVATISPQACIRELADLFYTTGVGYAAVVDEGGDFVGEVGVLDLLRAGLPHYTDTVQSLSFLESFAPLESLAEREDTLAVERIMVQPPVQLGPETSIVEAVFQLTRNKRDCLPVIRKERIVGLLCGQEIVKRVLRG
jgi:PTS system nitrogen regulatory IIA component